MGSKVLQLGDFVRCIDNSESNLKLGNLYEIVGFSTNLGNKGIEVEEVATGTRFNANFSIHRFEKDEPRNEIEFLMRRIGYEKV